MQGSEYADKCCIFADPTYVGNPLYCVADDGPCNKT